MTKPGPEKLNPPDLILRVGFAGIRTIPENNGRVADALNYVLPLLARQLHEISRSDLVGKRSTRKAQHAIARFYSSNPPAIRLISGLAEGADELAARALDRIDPACVRTELAAVIPFEVEKYRESRPPDFRPMFDCFVERCSYVLALDGNYRSGDDGKSTRARAYRAQATMLLRHSDILLAVADLNEPTRLGGTTETIKAALDSELPVIFIDAINGRTRLLDPGSDISSALVENTDAATTTIELETQLARLITNIVADPDSTGSTYQAPLALVDEHDSFGEKLLEEYFQIDSRVRHQIPIVERSTVRKRLWEWFEAYFQPATKSNIADWTLASIEKHRSRSTSLNYHYAGLYRGAFILNYLLAVGAVFLAALSLILLQQPNAVANDSNRHIAEQEHNAAPAQIDQSEPTSPNNKIDSFKQMSPTKLIVLLVLGGMKLGIVVFILRNTHRANHENWNDKAIDYRYLAERLRSMFYLPRTGSFQPPAIGRPQYASRVVRQSAVDWLFRALSRAISPVEFASRTSIDISNGKKLSIAMIRIDSKTVLNKVIESWIAGQFNYHDRLALTMSKMYRDTEKWSRWLTLSVIAAVTLDVLILTAEFYSLLPHEWESFFSVATPWLVFLAALLPAAVASLNGVRFQSECRRLADRSAVVRSILGGHGGAHEPGGWMREAQRLLQQIMIAEMEPVSNPGSWNVEVMLLCEQIASDLTQEVAEWSVLYAKEIPEP